MVAFLAHIVQQENVGAVKTTAPDDVDIAQIKTELVLISQDWKMSPDPEGHYIDIVARPVMPTGLSFPENSEIETEYEEVNVATIYLEQPRSELILDAQFICQAPWRIEKLIELLEAKTQG